MKVVVFNVKYSENLGDGLLAECVRSALASGRDEIEVETIDLAGRQAFATGHGGRRRLALELLHRLPAGAVGGSFASYWSAGCARFADSGKRRLRLPMPS